MLPKVAQLPMTNLFKLFLQGKMRMDLVIFVCKDIFVKFLELEPHTEDLPLGRSYQFCIPFKLNQLNG